MRCEDCIRNHRAYCFLDPDRVVPGVVLTGIRIVMVPRVERTYRLAIQEAGE